jgi:AraC-like DNA-binding protein
MTLLDHVSALMDRQGLAQGAFFHAASGAHLLRYTALRPQDAAVYTPLLCMVLQGAKEVRTSAKTLRIADGQSLVVSHTLPVVSRITKATSTKPYVAIVLPIDSDLLRTLAPDVAATRGGNSQSPFSISLSETDSDLQGSILRFLQQCESEDSRKLLSPITRREIHARLLLGPQRELLHKLLWHETTASRIFMATMAIQSDLSRPITVADLAQKVAMSSSAFFEHFKAVTGTSPVQYQKELRLLNARDALRSTSNKISDVAFSVGYESASQFSRDYVRKFGRPPRQDRSYYSVE